MIPNFEKQVQNSDKNTDIKYDDSKIIASTYDSVLEVSMSGKTIVHDQKILGFNINSMAKTPDNKS